MNPTSYKRLPGRGRRGGFVSLAVMVTRCSLWLGDDHLLLVNSTGYQEDYKRFYYRDIQAILLRKTRAALAWGIVFGILTGLFVLMALAFPTAGLIGAGLFGLCLLIHFMRGPSCVCHVRTAVHTEELPSLHRVWTAQRAIARLRPRIEEAQGTLTPELLAASDAGATAATAIPRAPVPAIRRESGAWHAALFGVLLVDAGWTFLDYWFNHLLLTLGATLLALTAGGLVIVALVRQHDSDAPSPLRKVTFASLGYVLLMFVTGYVVFFSMAIQNPTMADNTWHYIRAVTQMSPEDSPWLAGAYIVSILMSAILGATGMLLLWQWRGARKLEG